MTATANTKLLLTADHVPVAPEQLTTDRLIVIKGVHGYETSTSIDVDVLHFQAQKPTYRQLGLCLLSALFHSKPDGVTVTLSHPRSQIKTLVFPHKKAERLSYEVHAPERYPIHFPTGDPRLPGFESSSPTTILSRATANGDLTFASILLSISDASVTGNEYLLECDLGVGGVCAGSPEVCLWLPGGLGWDGIL